MLNLIPYQKQELRKLQCTTSLHWR